MKMKKEEGITLIALMITIIIMLIIAGISLSTGSDSLNNTRLKGFYTKLDIVNKRVDEIALTNESYVNSKGEVIYIKEQGMGYEDFTEEKKANLQNIMSVEEINLPIQNFRYFTSNELKSILDISEVEYNVFIDFDNRVVIAEDGIKIDDKTYYTLEDNKYLVKYDENILPTIVDINYTTKKYEGNKYKISVIPIYSDNVTRSGKVKYKKSASSYWETSNNLEIVIEELTNYDIMYKDSYNNTKEESILVELDDEENLIITKIDNNN